MGSWPGAILSGFLLEEKLLLDLGRNGRNVEDSMPAGGQSKARMTREVCRGTEN